MSDTKTEWEETIERLFKTLVTPISLTFAVTWSFLFFYGTKIADPSYILETGLRQLAQDFTILLSSLVLWIVGNFTRGTKSMLFRLFGFNLLTFLLLISPRSIFISYLNTIFRRGSEFSINLSFSIILLVQGLIFIFSLPPSVRSRISKFIRK
jgi:hypothetical protein